jgi:hypothetical protein
MDGLKRKEKKNGAVMGLSSRRFVVMEQETSREGNRIVVPSFFSSPPDKEKENEVQHFPP